MFLDSVDTYKDELTQLYNKHFLELIITEELKKSRRYGTKFSVLLLDLDNFNLINNLYGHKEGDRILFEFAKFLRNLLRESDSIVRLGGDKFVAVLPHTTIDNAEEAARRVISSLKKVTFSGVELSCSIGIAEAPAHGSEWMTLYSRLDTALFKAKKLGKGTFYSLPLEEKAFPLIPTKTLVDRTYEKNLLIQKLNDAYPPIILLLGPAGVGKTRILNDVAKKLDIPMVISTNPGSSFACTPFYPFRILLNKIKNLNYFSYQEAIEKLDEREAIALSLPNPEVGYIPEGVDRYKFFDSFSKLLAALARSEKILFIIDDAQSIDASSFELLNYLLHMEIPDFKIVLGAREDEITGKPIENFLSHISRERLLYKIRLEALSKEDTFELIEAILQGKCSESLKETIFMKSGGNPFFVEEVIKELYKQEIIFYDNDQWHLSDVPSIYIPESIENIISGRLESFKDDAILELIASMGYEFNVKTLELVTNINPGELYDTIDMLVKFNILIEKSTDVFTFKEDVTREIILSKMSEAKKRFVHKNILNVLEKNPEMTVATEELLSYHAYYAGETEKIKKYSILAARKLKNIFAYEEALKYYKWYLEVEDDTNSKVNVFLEYVDVLITCGELNRAAEELKANLPILKDYDEIYYKLAEVYSKIGYFSEALFHIDNAIQLCPKKLYKLRKAWILHSAGKDDEAEIILREFYNREEELTEREKAYYYNCFALLLKDKEEYDQSEVYFRKALEIREKLGDHKGVAGVHLNLGVLFMSEGKCEKALKEYKEALSSYSYVGDKRGMFSALNNIGNSLNCLKQYEDAIESVKNAINISRQIGALSATVISINSCVDILFKTGALDEAEKMLKEAEEIALELQEDMPLIYTYENMIKLYACYMPNYEMARKIQEKLEPLLDKISARSEISAAVLSIAESLICSGCFAETLEILKKYNNLFLQEKDTELTIQYLVFKAISEHKCMDLDSFRETVRKLSVMKNQLSTIQKDFYSEYFAKLLFYIGKVKGAFKTISKLTSKAKDCGYGQEALRLEKILEKLQSKPLG